MIKNRLVLVEPTVCCSALIAESLRTIIYEQRTTNNELRTMKLFAGNCGFVEC